MTLSEAHYLAETIIAKLMPVTSRCKIVGSIRRQRHEISDVDIVCEPKRDAVKDLFGNVTDYVAVPEFVAIVNSWQKIIGDPQGKYTKRLVDGHKVELTMANNWTFWPLVVIRTGDQEFTHMLMKRINKLGFEQRDGGLWRDDKKIMLNSEREYFELLNLPWIEPQDRNASAFK